MMARDPQRAATLALLLVTVGILACGCTVQPSPGGSPAPSATSTDEPSPAPVEHGDAATWTPDDPEAIDDGAVELTVWVTRLGCADGETGELLPPQIAYEDDRVVIQVDAAPLGDGAYTCPGNDAVPVAITLDEPLGARDLVDGACLEGEAASTAACEAGAVRYSAPSP